MYSICICVQIPKRSQTITMFAWKLSKSLQSIRLFMMFNEKSFFLFSSNEIDFFQGFNQFIFDDFLFRSFFSLMWMKKKVWQFSIVAFKLKNDFSGKITFFISSVKPFENNMIGFCAVAMSHESDISMGMANEKDSGFHCCAFFIGMK